MDKTGRHVRRWILGLDEGLVVIIRRWIRLNTTKKGEPNMTAQKFREYINTEIIIPEIAATKTDKVPATDMTREIPANNPFKHAPVTKTTSREGVVTYSIGLATATSWLHKLGCQYRDPQSGLYFDGHDRADVLKYRVEEYLPAYFEHLDYTEVWIDATCEGQDLGSEDA